MRQTMIGKLPLLLLLVTPLYAAPELTGSREALDHDPTSAVSEEHLLQDHKPLDLEDLADWSTSTEVLDENHAWFQRRRRSLTRKPTKMEDLDDLEAAESVVFMPAHLRQKKKMSFQDCRKRHLEHKSSRRTYPSTPQQVIWDCNSYCCYPVIETN